MKLKGRALKALIEAIKIYEYKKHYPNKFGPLTVLWIKELEVEEEELPGENVASDEDAAYLLTLGQQGHASSEDFRLHERHDPS